MVNTDSEIVAPAEGEEQAIPNELLAVVRVKLAKKKPEPVELEEGVEAVEIPESDREDVPVDDKCLSIKT